ncbi:MAG: bifunctional pyr operon transcriptional regulator/uracil phosphoribosyltransferase PyrR [Actinomycetota bacterium]|nr:bifunctional pyr operon transcriptional regulator/uracil phosphoribosyltransferase PyrR [Actinomycetota bacterium]
MASSTGTNAPREVMSATDVRRAIVRIAHEIVERNHGVDGLAIVGLQRGGTWIAEAITKQINEIETSVNVPVGALDVSLHRDDIGIRPVSLGAISNIPFDLSGATVVLVDDVLFTGRTVRAAMEGLNNYGRPRSVQLAVLVDRGHRELPIRPDFVGKNLPTQQDDEVSATSDGVVISVAIVDAR